LTEFFGGSLKNVIFICNYTSGFQPEPSILLTRWPSGQWATSTVKSIYSGLQQSRLISRISSCRILLFQTVGLSLWLNSDVAVYTALVLAMDCNISLFPARPYFSGEYPRWQAMTGSGDNVTIS